MNQSLFQKDSKPSAIEFLALSNNGRDLHFHEEQPFHGFGEGIIPGLVRAFRAPLLVEQRRNQSTH